MPGQEASIIFYILDDRAGVVNSGWVFTNSALYRRKIDMNFGSNLWQAAMGSTMVVTNQPITNTGAPLHLGDIAAVWKVCTVGSSGNNFIDPQANTFDQRYYRARKVER